MGGVGEQQSRTCDMHFDHRGSRVSHLLAVGIVFATAPVRRLCRLHAVTIFSLCCNPLARSRQKSEVVRRDQAEMDARAPLYTRYT